MNDSKGLHIFFSGKTPEGLFPQEQEIQGLHEFKMALQAQSANPKVQSLLAMAAYKASHESSSNARQRQRQPAEAGNVKLQEDNGEIKVASHRKVVSDSASLLLTGTEVGAKRRKPLKTNRVTHQSDVSENKLSSHTDGFRQLKKNLPVVFPALQNEYRFLKGD